MTREPHPRRNGRYIDRGHYGRKVVWWIALVVAVLLLTVPYVVATLLAAAVDFVADQMMHLKQWTHPCLYRTLPRMPAPDLAPGWKARVPETRSEEKS